METKSLGYTTEPSVALQLKSECNYHVRPQRREVDVVVNPLPNESPLRVFLLLIETAEPSRCF